MLRDELVVRGNSLFRWRSFLPLALVPSALWMGWEAPDWAHAQAWQVGCWVVGLTGLGVRAKTIGHVPPGTSGRNTSEGQVAESLNTRGMYSLVRHPLYLGNYLMWMGLVLATGRMDFALVVTLLYMIYYLRIAMAEEAFLEGKFGDVYAEWSQRVPAFVPGRWRGRRSAWTPAGNTISWRHVLKREYNGTYALLLGYFALDAVRTAGAGEPSHLTTGWQAGLAGCTLAFLMLRFLKKRTQLLHVEGREFT